MADFSSQFWHWFIVVPTVLGLVAVIWLTFANTEKVKRGTETETMGHVWDEDLQEYNNPLPRWWLNLFYITVAFGVIYFVLYPGLGTFKGVLDWQQTSQYEAEIQAAEETFGPLFDKYAALELGALAQDPQAMQTGARLFSSYCTTCHGSDARGAMGFPNLRDKAWLYGGEPQTIKTSILQGRNGAMPPWAAALGEQGVVDVVEYVRSLSGKSSDPALVVAGEQRYKQLCVACHGLDGKGNKQLGAPDLTDNYWLYGGSPRAITKSVAEGRQGRMPAHKEFLGEARVHLLAAYVYSLSAGQTE
ncbi:MAG: cytochrome-c oxidase, cbb3-type subunit III [Gammaproteobacteria bacterium]